MFLEKSLAQRRRECGGRRVVVLILVLAFIFIGCPSGDEEWVDTARIPVGEWDSGFDRYTITDDLIDYFMEGSEWEGMIFPDTIIKGSIELAKDFSKDSGVLIIKVTESSFDIEEKYTAVYYRDFASSDIKLANPVDANYLPVAVNDYETALTTFTQGSVSTYVSMWGSYSR